MQEIAKRVRAARQALGLSIEAASEAADITPSQWRYFERGRDRLPEPTMFHRICWAVELDPKEMLEVGGYV